MGRADTRTDCRVLLKTGADRLMPPPNNNETASHTRECSLQNPASLCQHPYSQTELNDRIVSMVIRWIGLNSQSTRDVLFHRAREGGLGVPNIEWVYVAARVFNLLRMLNSHDSAVRELARAPLHLRRNKAPPSTSEDASFLGFKKMTRLTRF